MKIWKLIISWLLGLWKIRTPDYPDNLKDKTRQEFIDKIRKQSRDK